MILERVNDKIHYEYDFGDGWNHTILLDDIWQNDSELILPKCIDGERACPPENCGGISGYNNLVEILKDKTHKEYKGLAEWLGKVYNSEEFEILKINAELMKLHNYIEKYESKF